MSKLKIFIASSSEGLTVANFVKELLEERLKKSVEVNIWNH